MSSGCAYVQGYRTERLSTTYKDIDKPRTFDTSLNQSLTSDFGNYILTTNQHQAPTLYESIELRDEVTGTSVGTPAGTVIGKARAINFSYESGTVNTQSSVYRTNIIDTQFYVKVTTTGSVTWLSLIHI